MKLQITNKDRAYCKSTDCAKKLICARNIRHYYGAGGLILNFIDGVRCQQTRHSMLILMEDVK